MNIRRVTISTHVIVRIVFSLCFFLAGCDKKVEKPKGRPPALVVTAAATVQNVPVLIRAIGNIEASESVAIRTQVSGELTKVAFREGQDVPKGELLFQLDSRTLQENVEYHEW